MLPENAFVLIWNVLSVTKSVPLKLLKEVVLNVEKEIFLVVIDTRPATETLASVSTKCVRTTSCVSENFPKPPSVWNVDKILTVKTSKSVMTMETVNAETNSVKENLSALQRMSMESALNAESMKIANLSKLVETKTFAFVNPITALPKPSVTRKLPRESVTLYLPVLRMKIVPKAWPVTKVILKIQHASVMILSVRLSLMKMKEESPKILNVSKEVVLLMSALLLKLRLSRMETAQKVLFVPESTQPQPDASKMISNAEPKTEL